MVNCTWEVAIVDGQFSVEKDWDYMITPSTPSVQVIYGGQCCQLGTWEGETCSQGLPEMHVLCLGTSTYSILLVAIRVASDLVFRLLNMQPYCCGQRS